MGLSPLTFTGVSAFSNDLQTVLNRAVAIAQIPLTRLQNEDTDLLQRQTALGQMTQPLTDLGNAVAALGKIAASKAVTASSSDSTKVSVVNTGSEAAAVYTIKEITSVAKAASETSVTAFPDSASTAVSAHGSMRLVVGSDHYDFSLGSNNLLGLRDKINSLDAGVSATILTTSGGNYLSISAARSGHTTLQLIDDPATTASAFLTSANQGTNAEFKLNGISISRSSNQVNDIVPGITFNILGKTDTGQSVDLTLKTDRNQLSSAINTFATNYNAVVDLVGQQVGPNAGLLSGDFLVREVQEQYVLEPVEAAKTSPRIARRAGRSLEQTRLLVAIPTRGVRMRGPSGRIATVCSKCAAREPSVVEIVQPSSASHTSGPTARDHRLDRDRHALREPRPAPRLAEVRHVRVLVVVAADAMPDQAP